MKNLLALTTLLMFVWLSTHALELIQINPTEQEPVTVNVLESYDETTIVEVLLNHYYIGSTEIEDDEYYNIHIPSLATNLDFGYPETPVLSRSLMIPAQAKMHIEILESTFSIIYGQIMPSKGYLSNDQDPNEIPFVFSNVYQTDAYFPEDLAELTDPYILRELRGITFRVTPLAVNPVQNQIRIYDRIVIKVYADGFDTKSVLDNSSSTITKDFENMYKTHFLNYENANSRNLISEQGSMLVICHDDFMQAIQPFVDWKNQKGIKTVVIPFSSIGTNNPNNIRQFIQNYQIANQNLAYIQLVGNNSHIPTMMFLVNHGTIAQPRIVEYASDVSYVIPDNNNHRPNLFIGRFSADTISDVETQVERTIYYEKYIGRNDHEPSNNVDMAWLSKAMGLVQDTETDFGHNGLIRREHMEEVRKLLINKPYQHIDRLYSHNENDFVTFNADDVFDLIDEGRSLINFSGHGQPQAWCLVGTAYYTFKYVIDQTNDWMLPHVVSATCYTGDFVNGNPSFAETWLRATNPITLAPTGAIAAYMSSMSAQRAMLQCTQLNIAASISSQMFTSIGALYFNGAINMLNDYPNQHGYDTIRTYIIFGDASLIIRNTPPDIILVSASNTIPQWSNDFSVRVTSPINNLDNERNDPNDFVLFGALQGALVSLYNPVTKVLYGSAYTDINGYVTINFSQTLDTDNDLLLTVTAYNKITEISQIKVTDVTTMVINPGDCFQTRLDDLLPGGVVYISPGTYELGTTLYISGKDFTLLGMSNNPADTVIIGDFDISDIIDGLIVIENLTLVHPDDIWVSNVLKLTNAPARIENVVFNLKDDVPSLGILSTFSIQNFENNLDIISCRFNYGQGVFFNGNELNISSSVFYQNTIFEDGSSIHFTGNNLDINNSKIDVLSNNNSFINALYINLLPNFINKEINFYKNDFTTGVASGRNFKSDLIGGEVTPIDTYNRQLIRISGDDKYNLNIERNIFRKKSHDNLINDYCVVRLVTAPNGYLGFSNTIVNNTDTEYTELNYTPKFLVLNPSSYAFMPTIPQLGLTVRNNIFSSAFNDVKQNDVPFNWFIPIQGDPLVDIITLQPRWEQNVKSPLIGAGYVPDRLSWFDNPEYNDPVNARLTIGALPTIDHTSQKISLERVPYNFNASNKMVQYNWVSFSYLDKLYTGQPTTVYHVLHEHNDNNLLDLEDRFLVNVQWNSTGVTQNVSLVDGAWTNTGHILDSRYGYKIAVAIKDEDTHYDIITSGFLIGTPNNPATTMTVHPPVSGQYNEYWFAFTLSFPIEPLVALSMVEPWLIEIKTRDWAYSRNPNNNNDWEIPAGNPYINPGELVSIRYIGTEIKHFEWNFYTVSPFTKYTHPQTHHFKYQEEADYIPIYVHLPEEMVGEGRGEIGFLINGEPYGAEVIMDDPWLQINAYIVDMEFEEPEIEFAFFEYGMRSGAKRIENFAVLNNEDRSFSERTIDLNTKQPFYVVSFNNEDLGSNDIEPPSHTHIYANYPNPFNPTTTISFDIAKETNVRIDIYNIRGQRIKTLVNTHHKVGRYKVDWHGTDDNERKVSSGVYFYQMRTEDYTDIRRMVLLK